ncbi:MAG: hypothetical protein K8R79_00150 [Calditrichales bacterium]|nr:hypothetical protein [Calditrichales bacterium]
MNKLKENTGHGNMTLPSITCGGTIKHHHETLIGMAQDALERKEYELSVILSTSSCEMLTERAFRLLFIYRDIEHLYNSFIKGQWGYNNITNKKSRILYIVLSKDDISKTFEGWSKFRKHYKRRHEIAHRGKTVEEEDARESCQIVNDYIKHIEAVIEKTKPENCKQ